MEKDGQIKMVALLKRSITLIENQEYDRAL
jgi:hypothetical protein